MQENHLKRCGPEVLAKLALYSGLVLLGWLLWGWVSELGILGWDSYPLIAAGRVDSPGSFFGTFGEELMDGRYPLGHFWRPLVHLSFALDHALHGLDPRGYHFTDLILLGSCACLVARLGLQLAGPRGWLAGATAGLAWILHPLQLEVLSVPARRAETLAILFTCLALSAVLGRQRSSTRHALWVGCLCAAALASKETGIIALPLVLAAAALQAQSRAAALRSLLPAVWVLCLAGAWRTWVLGGLGGSASSSVALGIPGSSPYLLELLFPSDGLGVPNLAVPTGWLGPGLIAVLVLAMWLLHHGRSTPQGSLHAGVLLGFWYLLLASVTAMAGIEQSWYALPFLVPLALWMGCLAELALRRLRASEGKRPWLAVGALALCAILLGSSAQISAFSDHRRVSLLRANESNQSLVEQFQEQLLRAAGTQTEPLYLVEGFDWQEDGSLGSPPVRVHTQAPYSLQALADLLVGDRRVRVLASGQPQPAATNPNVMLIPIEVLHLRNDCP